MWWHALIGVAVAFVLAAAWVLGVNGMWHYLELPMPRTWQPDRDTGVVELELGHDGDPESWQWSLPEDVYERWCWRWCWRCNRWIPSHLFNVSVCHARTL